jgi:hypothetical protein
MGALTRPSSIAIIAWYQSESTEISCQTRLS